MATLPLRNPSATIGLTGDRFSSRWEFPVESSVALTEPNEQAFTFPAKASSYKVVLRNNILPDWVEPIISAFIGIQNLPENWDSYGGKPVNRDLINQSLFTLGQIMKADSPTPSVVPLGDGGIQVEWHRRQQDLEIMFPADEAPQFYYSNRMTGLEQQGFANEIENLTRLLINLA